MDLWKHRQTISELCVSSLKNDDRDIEFSGTLLEAEIAITRQKHIKFLFCAFQQFAVFQTCPSHPFHGNSGVRLKLPDEPPIQTFVDKNTHLSNHFEHGQLPGLDHGTRLLAFHRRERS